jgi:hypothetical protein
LSEFAGQNIYLKFSLVDDKTNASDIYELTDPGIHINNVRVLSGKIMSENSIIAQKPNIILHQNYPNPFNATTTIELGMRTLRVSTQQEAIHRREGYTELGKIEVFNIKGQKVKTLFDGYLESGEHTIVWNGDDNNGNSVGSGIYFYRLKIDNETIAIKKALLLK